MAEPASTTTRLKSFPEKIGKYDIINEVGQGSSGRVFLSHDPYYGRDVAIKVYNCKTEEDEDKARITPRPMIHFLMALFLHPILRKQQVIHPA